MTCLEIYRDVVTDMLAPEIRPKQARPQDPRARVARVLRRRAYERVMVRVRRSAPASWARPWLADAWERTN